MGNHNTIFGENYNPLGHIAILGDKKPLRFVITSYSIHYTKLYDALGVDADGAGDQGIMFGYATDESKEFGDEEYMPGAIYFSHMILRSMAEARHSGASKIFLPDAKSQVTLKYENGKPVGAASIVVSTQHVESATQEEIREAVRAHVLKVLPEGWMCLV